MDLLKGGELFDNIAENKFQSEKLIHIYESVNQI